MYKVIFLAEALNEIENAGAWYGDRQENLDKKFVENILAAIEKLQSDKINYGPVYRGLSRILIKKFPYIVYFRKDLERKRIIIHGVLHAKQSRSNLDKRA